jgi:putative hydrolase of the HAD superfamily
MKWARSSAFDGNGHSLDDYFDACYLSYVCKMMKPDPDFFRLVLAQEKVQPEELCFLDDGPRNIEVAQSLGIRTLLVENNGEWSQALAEKLKA